MMLAYHDQWNKIPVIMTSMVGIREIRIMEMKPDIENMTLNEYLEYEAEKERRLWDNVRSRRSPNNYNEADVDSFHQNKRAENMKRIGKDIVQDCIWEQDNDLEEDQKDDGDDRDTFDMWDIMVEDVERIRQFLTSNVPDIIEVVIQPLIPTTQHTIPSNEDYVAPTTKPILDELLEDKILNVAMVDEEADPTRDLEEPKRLLIKDPHFTKIQSSTKPHKVDREMKSPSRYGLKSSFPYPIANGHPNDVYCYFHPHLIPAEGMDTLLPSK
ncbi:hypothetical protein Tco_1411920 [Tanacetum coccineum]